MDAPTHNPGALLLALDALVRAQPGPTGLRGDVCFGVRGQDDARWWRARLSPSGAVTEFLDDLPEEVDVAVGLDADAAASLLSEAEPPLEALRLVAGDRALLAAFVERYVVRRSLLELRANQGKKR